MRFIPGILLCSLVVGMALPCKAEKLGPSHEERTLNTDQYEIAIQRNGRTDVTLVSGVPIFTDVVPMVWFDGEEKPSELDISGIATQRGIVRSPIGEGQEITFQLGNCSWVLRTYPTRHYWTAQVVYINSGKKKVHVRSLIPWAVGEPGKGHLTLGTGITQTQVLQHGDVVGDRGTLSPNQAIGKEKMASTGNLVLLNKTAQKLLITGALTAKRATTRFVVKPDPEKDVFQVFRAECLYDAPVEVPPGERLESEVIYFSATESSIFEGLERYAGTFAALNKIPLPHVALPGGVFHSSKYGTAISEDHVISVLDRMDKQLKRYGWRHMIIDSGWERATGDWEPNPERFPHGMKWLTDQIHSRDMTAGLCFRPFTVKMDSPVAQQHPDWLLELNDTGRSRLSSEERILDATNPAVYDFIKALTAKIGSTWDFDAIEITDSAQLLSMAQKYSDPAMTHVQAMLRGLEAIREGLGPDKTITAADPFPFSSFYADAVHIGTECAPIWRGVPEKESWGAVDVARNAAHYYYYAPYLWRPDHDCFYFAQDGTRQHWKTSDLPALTLEQTRSWLTLQALTGGAVKFGDWLPDMKPEEVDSLTKILPVPAYPARPIDLFEREIPAIWSLPIKTPAGQWNIVAVFNWDESKPVTLPLELDALGLNSTLYYTVYDFWQDQYFGLTKKQLNVSVPPGSVHLLGFRQFDNHPMFLASDRHFTQGASDHTAIEWNQQTRTLKGVFNGVEDTKYNLRILVPDNYAPKEIKVSAEEVKTILDGKVLKIGFTCAEKKAVEWAVVF